MNYANRARKVCFDPADDPNAGKTFTQEDLNKILAEDRRKHQAQVVKIQQTLEETLSSKTLASQEKEQLAQRVEELQRSQETAAQTAARERRESEQAAQKKIQDAEKTAQTWQSKWKEKTVAADLATAISGPEIFNPAQLEKILRDGVKLEQVRAEDGTMTDQYVTTVTFDDMDDMGNPKKSTMSPKDAVKRMQKLPNLYGNQFRANIAGGIGGTSSSNPTGAGVVPKNLSPTQWAEMRKTPQGRQALGLRADPKRR